MLNVIVLSSHKWIELLDYLVFTCQFHTAEVVLYILHYNLFKYAESAETLNEFLWWVYKQLIINQPTKTQHNVQNWAERSLTLANFVHFKEAKQAIINTHSSPHCQYSQKHIYFIVKTVTFTKRTQKA